MVGLALAAVLGLAGCYTGPDASHFAAIVEELPAPGGWQSIKTVVRGPDEEPSCDPFFSITCPGAVRSFFADGDPTHAYAQAKDLVNAAGFAVTEEFSPDCTGAPSAPLCSFFSSRDGDQLTVSIYHSGADAGLGDALRGSAAVLVTAHRD